jgi:hypothetical protein
MLAQNATVPGSSAAGDLGMGMGDQLQMQAEAAILERRKKIMAMTTQAEQGAAYGALAAGTGMMTGMGNAGGFAAQALLGTGGLT